MSEKGFDLKVLIPTDNGFNISENGVENARYYLLYNLSNRSYQLAGKIKNSTDFNINNLNDIFISNQVDKIIYLHPYSDFNIPVIQTSVKEISSILNMLIDKLNDD